MTATTNLHNGPDGAFICYTWRDSEGTGRLDFPIWLGPSERAFESLQNYQVGGALSPRWVDGTVQLVALGVPLLLSDRPGPQASRHMVARFREALCPLRREWQPEPDGSVSLLDHGGFEAHVLTYADPTRRERATFEQLRNSEVSVGGSSTGWFGKIGPFRHVHYLDLTCGALENLGQVVEWSRWAWSALRTLNPPVRGTRFDRDLWYLG